MNNLEKLIEQNEMIITLLTEIRDAITEPVVPITRKDRDELEKVFKKKPLPVRVEGYTERPTKEAVEG